MTKNLIPRMLRLGAQLLFLAFFVAPILWILMM